jgi:hypothetical protein
LGFMGFCRFPEDGSRSGRVVGISWVIIQIKGWPHQRFGKSNQDGRTAESPTANCSLPNAAASSPIAMDAVPDSVPSLRQRRSSATSWSSTPSLF